MIRRHSPLLIVFAAACTDETLSPAPEPTNGSYQVAHGWPAFTEGELLGQCSGVGIEADGSVLVFRRAGKDWNGGPIEPDMITEPTVLRFDPDTGELLGSFGAADFAMPHGLTVDSRGHIWLTDVELQQVFELDAAGTILRSFGERGIAGADESHFNMPTDVAVADDGTFYVSDGYGNGRVLKFAASGELLGTWGQLGAEPGQFITPHGIALGPDGNVYVADRGNARVQSFSPDGAFIAQWKSEELGRPWSIAFGPDGSAFVVDGGDQPPRGPDRARILIADESGTVISSFASFGNQDGELIRPHDIAVADDGSVYVVEVGVGKRAQKFVP
ncbi:MAG: hypothetical protein HOV80_31060 [Polyangiaceae bacterium]|nr:hypothetical protein [Polyangiaceae bacterium]